MRYFVCLRVLHTSFGHLIRIAYLEECVKVFQGKNLIYTLINKGIMGELQDGKKTPIAFFGLFSYTDPTNQVI